MNQIYIDGCFTLNRTVIIEDGDLTHLYYERLKEDSQEGNIYLGRVAQIIPGMNAAFVDIGKKENAYLHFRDAVPWSAEGPRLGEKASSISKYLKGGMEIFVQIIGEASQYKGCKVTMKLALPGKYIVLMPLSTQRSTSRKITDPKRSKDIQNLVQKLLPADVGYIVRTEASGADNAELEEEISTLLKRWQGLYAQRITVKAPKLLTKTASTLQRALLDHLNEETEFVRVNQAELYMNLRDFLSQTALEHLSGKLKLMEDPLMFEKIGVEKSIRSLSSREVNLPSGGFLIVDETEAMTMIDVNSGKSKVGYNQRELALSTNCEAAKEAARQIKLRNLGGIILIDFIDMDHSADRQEVMKVFKAEAFKDRVGINVMGFTALGILEMTRKKAGKRLSDFTNGVCSCCGSNHHTSVEYWLDEMLRDLYRKFRHNPTEVMCYQIDQKLADYIESLRPDVNKWLLEISSDIEYEVLPYLASGFKMTYMGRRK